MSWLALSASFEYLSHYNYFSSYSPWIDCRRQHLTSTVDPRAVRLNLRCDRTLTLPVHVELLKRKGDFYVTPTVRSTVYFSSRERSILSPPPSPQECRASSDSDWYSIV